MKSYTDLRVEAEEMSVTGGIGLEPCFAQLAKAFKRVVPPDFINSDGSAASIPSATTLQPWDKMRYVWRGSLK